MGASQMQVIAAMKQLYDIEDTHINCVLKLLSAEQLAKVCRIAIESALTIEDAEKSA